MKVNIWFALAFTFIVVGFNTISILWFCSGESSSNIATKLEKLQDELKQAQAKEVELHKPLHGVTPEPEIRIVYKMVPHQPASKKKSRPKTSSYRRPKRAPKPMERQGTPMMLSLSRFNFKMENMQQLYKERHVMEEHLRDYGKYSYQEAFGRTEKELSDAIDKAGVILINDVVLRVLCIVNEEHPTFLHTAFVADLMWMGIEEMNKRVSFLRDKLSRATHAYKVGFIGDIHPYSFGRNGHSGAAQCFDHLGVSSLYSFYLFTADILSLANSIMGMRRPMNISWIPLHAKEKPFSREKKEFDIILYGSTNPNTYPMRARLFEMINTTSSWDVIVCQRDEGFVRKNGRVTQLKMGACYGDGLKQFIQSAKLAVVTPGRAHYLVMKYFEIPLASTVMMGTIPYDAEFFFNTRDFLHFTDADPDKLIRKKINAALADENWLQNTAERTYYKVRSTFGLERYNDHIIEALYGTEKYNPIPKYLSRPYDHSILKHFDLYPQEFARSNSWGGLETLLLDLSGLPDIPEDEQDP